MTVTLHDPTDPAALVALVAREPDARQRDRYRAALLAAEGLPRAEIARRLGRSTRFVDEWVARYRRGGTAGLVPRRRPGRRPKLTPEQAERLKARLDAGPRPADGVCALRGKDIRRIVATEFGVAHTLGGIYDVLRRLGYSSPAPRPRHRKNDPAAAARFEADAPLLPGRCATPARASGSAGSCRTRPGWASRAP